MSNNITIELCAEDRARIDRLIVAMEARTCDKCVAQALEAMRPQPITVIETDPLLAALANTRHRAEGASEEPTKESAEGAKASTPASTPQEEEKPTRQADDPSPTAKLVTEAEVRAKVIQLSADGKKAQAREVVKAYATRVPDIPEDKLAEVLDKLNALEKGGAVMTGHGTRAHALLSASSAHRWLACPASAVAAEKYPDQDTDYTREGTLAHEVAEIKAREHLTLSDIFLPEDATTEMVECAIGYCDYIQEQIKDPDAVVLLEQRVDFSPWVPDGFGTCDCIILQGDTLTIIDYKYGQGVPVSAKDNPQMKLYALGALNDYGFACDVARVEMHIYQPRIDNISDDGLEVHELLKWADLTVKPVATKAAQGKGGYTPGEHCRFCPHAGRCRALTKVCTEYVETHSLRVAVPVLAPHEVAEVLKMEPLVTLWLRRVKDQALATLLDGGTVPGYKVVEGKLGNRKWADEMKVAEKLKEAGFTLEDITETKLHSPAGMDKAIGKKRVAELLDGLINRSPGAPTVVPETDKRPAYDRLAEAQKDFE